MFDDEAGPTPGESPGGTRAPADPWPAPGQVGAVPRGSRAVTSAPLTDGAVLAVTDAIGEVASAVAALRGRARAAVSAQERASWLTGLRQLADAVEVVFTEVLGAFDAHGDGQLLAAAPSTSSWCRRELLMAPGDASGRVRLARLCAAEPTMARTLDQVAEGTLRYEQARQICRSVRCLDGPSTDEVDRARRADAVELLATLAAAADPSTIAAAGRRIAEVVDPDGALTTREQQLARRYLQISPLLDGMTALDGVLDAEGAATLSAALAPLLVPAGPDDSRSTAQRRADALVDVAALALRTQELPQLSGSPAAVDVVVTAETLARCTALPGQDSRTDGSQHPPAARLTQAPQPGGPGGRGLPPPPTPRPTPPPRTRTSQPATPPSCGRHEGRAGDAGGTAEGRRPEDPVVRWLSSPWAGLVGPNAGGVVPGAPGGPAMLAADVVARWLCDASVGRLLLGPDSVPLDLGRRQRLFTAEQRRALLLRDAGCRFPGCDRPPRYTDAHHLVSWAAGGATDLHNALLLCRFHHTRLHAALERGGWAIGMVDPGQGSNGVLTFTGPHGLVLTSAPRGP